MTSKFRRLLSLTLTLPLVAACLTASPSASAQQWIDAKDPKTLFALAKTQGFAPEMISKSGETPSFRMTTDGNKSLILFMDCDEANAQCKTVQFYAGYSVSDVFSLDRVNEWNRDKRFGRAYVDTSGDPIVEMDLDMDFNGLPRANVVESFQVWRSIVRSFAAFVNGGSNAEQG